MQQYSEVDDLGQQSARTAQIVTSMVLRFAEISARYREQRSRHLQTLREQAARDYAARFNLDRTRAEQHLRSVHDPKWWDRATAEQIIERWAIAQDWSENSPAVHDAQRVIGEQLQRRFGVTVDEMFDRAEGHRTVGTLERLQMITDLDHAEHAEDTDRADHDNAATHSVPTAIVIDSGASVVDPQKVDDHRKNVNKRAAALVTKGVSVSSAAAVIRDFPEGPAATVRAPRQARPSPQRTAADRGRSRDRGLER